MKNWIITIIGVILLNLIVEIILSESNLSSFIKKIFSIISVLLIISPITKLLNFDNINLYNIVFDSSYLDYSFGNYDVYIENYLKAILESNGFFNIEIDVCYNLSNNENKIKKIFLNLRKLVINENQVHINKYKEIKDIVSKTLNIEEDLIILNE